MKELQIRKPVIIIGCPRSGTSLLFRILSTSRHLWSLYRESNDIWSRFYKFTGKDFKDEVLTSNDLTGESKEFLIREFHKHALNNYYVGYFIREYLLKNDHNHSVDLISKANLFYKELFLKEYRIVEKTPKNCFRISFINKLFEDCKFIFLKRDGRSNINSLIEGWMHPSRYIRKQAVQIPLNIPDYQGKSWKFVLPPTWEKYTDKPLEEVCAFQWISSNRAALEGLKAIEDKRKYTITYEELADNTYNTIRHICDFIHIPFSESLKEISNHPPEVNYITKPKKDKWTKNLDILRNTYPIIEPMMKELGYSLKE